MELGLAAPAQLQCPMISAVRLSDTQRSCVLESRPLGAYTGRGSRGDQSPVPSMPNLQKHNEAPLNDVQAQNVEVAGSIVAHVDDLLGALSEMQGVTNYWKQKYMQCRSDHINKYAPTASSRGAEKAYHFWKNYVFRMGNVERLQRLKLDMQDLQDSNQDYMEDAEEEHRENLKVMHFHHEEAMATLNRKIEEHTRQCAEAAREREYYKKRDEMSRELLKAIGKLFEATPERVYDVHIEVADPAHECNFEYTVARVHDILNDVDPKYVPPVGSLCVNSPHMVPRVLNASPVDVALQIPSVFPRMNGNGQGPNWFQAAR